MFDHDEFENEMATLHYIEVKHETAKSRLIKFGIDAKTLESIEVWVPRSISTLDATDKTIEIEDWFVFQEDLEDYTEA